MAGKVSASIFCLFALLVTLTNCTQPSSNSMNVDYASSIDSSRAYHAMLIFFFAWILLFFSYLFHLCFRHCHWRRHWSTLWIGNFAVSFSSSESDDHHISRMEMGLGLKKELRELLPIVIFRESFFVKESQCCVCLADYEKKERLQQIPSCGHIFHLDCIDKWLENHATCPLCRQPILKVPGGHYKARSAESPPSRSIP